MRIALLGGEGQATMIETKNGRTVYGNLSVKDQPCPACGRLRHVARTPSGFRWCCGSIGAFENGKPLHNAKGHRVADPTHNGCDPCARCVAWRAENIDMHPAVPEHESAVESRDAVNTTLLDELQEAIGDAENSARSYRLLGKTERDVVKASTFEAKSARLRARAEYVRRLLGNPYDDNPLAEAVMWSTGNYETYRGDNLRETLKRIGDAITGSLPADPTEKTEPKEPDANR